jgi:hypothetical protein
MGRQVKVKGIFYEAESEKYGLASSSSYTHPSAVGIEALKIEKVTEGGTDVVMITVTFSDPVEKNYYGVVLNLLSPTWRPIDNKDESC